MPREDVTIEKIPQDKKKDEAKNVESLFSKGKKLSLDDDQQKRLIQLYKDEMEAIIRGRDEISYDDFCDEMDNQYLGIMPRRANQTFNLDCGVTKVKEDDIVRSIDDAHWAQDPIVSVSPRPGFAKGQGIEVCEQQEEFIDYALDEVIPFKEPFRLASSAAVRKKVGFIKWTHRVRKEWRDREETYIGKNDKVPTQDGQVMVSNKGVEDFMLAHREEVEKDPEAHKWIIDDLMAEKTVKINVKYQEVVYNDPFPTFVNNKNFYARVTTSGYLGLCEAYMIAEKINFTFHELKKLEKEHGFVNIDKLIQDADGEEIEGKKDETFDVFEVVIDYKINKEDEETKKVVAFISDEKQLFLGGINYPFTTIDCYYVPHYVGAGIGLYKDGVNEFLSDIHVTLNAILNFILEGAYISNTITPIADPASEIIKQWKSRAYGHGIPIKANPKDIDFLSNKLRPLDLGGLLKLWAELWKIADNISRVSSLRTGRESPLDPNAPGNKTIALLEESGKGVADYIELISSGFSIDAMIILRIYYEMGLQKHEYVSKRQKEVSGVEPKSISQSALIAKTNIQSQAYTYDFNKQNLKRETVAFNQMLRTEPLFESNPEGKYYWLRYMTKIWSPTLKNMVDKILPPPQQFQQKQAQLAMQGVKAYFDQMVAKAKTSGEQPELDPKALMGLMLELQKQATMNFEMQGQVAKQKEKND